VLTILASSSSVLPTEPEKPKKPAYVSKLSGKKLDKKYKNKRPFAFMFNNIEFAYPQTGTGRAEILYEILAEGGITRLMGVFDYMKGDRIGSVRSARHYYVDFANEFDAIFVHFGQTHYAIDEIKKLGVDTISGLSWEGAKAFYRDNRIRAPHNAFASAKGLMQAMKDKKLRTKPRKGLTSHFNFSVDEEVTNDREGSFKAKYVKVPFSGYMTPSFTYDKKEKNWKNYYALYEFLQPYLSGVPLSQYAYIAGRLGETGLLGKNFSKAAYESALKKAYQNTSGGLYYRF